jgi:hypothetical protein
MKRYKDDSRPSVPSVQGSPKPQIKHAAAHDSGVTTRLRALHTREEPATPVEAAAALIELSLHESNGPVEDLSSALARMMQLVRTPPGGTAEPAPERTQLQRELAICVESLQFHDRLTQQLTQVRNLLATLAFSDVPTDMAGRPVEGDPHNWMVLLENLRARFTSDSHRILFSLLLPGSGGRSSVPALHANEGSVELF